MMDPYSVPPDLDSPWKHQLRKVCTKHGSDIAVTFFVFVVQLLLNSIMPVHRADFQERDASLSFPFIEASNTAIPTYALAIISMVLPILMMLVVQLYLRWREYENIYSSDLLTTQLGLVQSLISAQFLTTLLKHMAGTQRPNFYSFCDYKEFRTNFSHYLKSTQGYGNWGSINDCMDEIAIDDACRSFPSTHAASAFAGMGFLTLYIRGVLNMHRQQKVLKALIVSGPILCACLVGVTRVRDHWSTETDVLCGSIIGMLCAYFSFSFNFSTINGDRETAANLYQQSYTSDDALFANLRSSEQDEIVNY